MNKKYELTDEKMIHNGVILYRIECIEAFDDVEIGDKGGWVESMYNLSQKGNAWIYGDAKVYNKACISGNAKVRGEAWVFGNARVYDNANVFDNAKVYGNAEVSGNAYVGDNAMIRDNVEVFGEAHILGNAKIFNNAEVFNNGRIFGKATVSGNAIVCGDVIIKDNAKVCGFVQISGDAIICGDAKIESINDYMIFKNSWSSGRHFTWTRSNNMWKVGCFYGTGEELINKAYEDSQQKGDCYKVIVDCVENIVKITNI